MLDPLRLGLSTSPRSFGQLDFTVSVWGLTRAGPVSLLPAIDKVHLGPSPSAHSRARLGPPMPVPDPLHIGPPTPPRSLCCLGFMVFSLGLSRVGPVSSPFVIDDSHLEPLLSLRSSARLDSAASILDRTHLEPPLLARSHGRLDLPLFACGMARFGLPMLASDGVCSAFSPSLRSMACLEPAAPVPDLLRPELLLSVRSFTCFGLAVPAIGLSCVGPISSLPVADNCLMGSAPFARSLSRPGSSSSALDVAHTDLPAPLKSPAHIGFTAPIMSMVRMGLLASALDLLRLDLALLLHSLARLDSALFVLEPSHLGFPVPLRSFAHLGSSTSLFGLSCPGPVSSLPVTDDSCLGPSFSLQSFARAGSAMPVLDPIHMGLPPSFRSSA